MWLVWENVKGQKSVFAQCWSESMAWMICKENNSVCKSARGIRYEYGRA